MGVVNEQRSQFVPGFAAHQTKPSLKDARIEQLPIPMHTVTVDLVSGGAVVRDNGDAVHGIIESINLPVLSVPICRPGQALVDGGLVNTRCRDFVAKKSREAVKALAPA